MNKNEELGQKERAVLKALVRMYYEDGELLRNDATYICAMAGQDVLDTFHDLEGSGVIHFNEDGYLDFMFGGGYSI